ncbi:MAG: CPBP family intramembrane metalloprotease [Rubellimicrobium sp.]|nr:CPBP family intramembrane metalloprotease [Rubellimicrobium sp.]
MDWRLALVMLGALPVFAGLVHWLTRWAGPLPGVVAALVLYWALIGALAWRALSGADRAALLAHARPPRLLAALAFVPVVAMAWLALGVLGDSGFPAILLVPVAVMALVNGTAEEMFWRGALLPAPDREGMVVAWALFALWHVSWGFARGLASPAGTAGLVIGAAAMGAVWMALRLRTGVLGPGIAAHVAFNLFAFADIAARNWPGAT